MGSHPDIVTPCVSRAWGMSHGGSWERGWQGFENFLDKNRHRERIFHGYYTVERTPCAQIHITQSCVKTKNQNTYAYEW